MKIQVAEIDPYGSVIIVAIVASEFTVARSGDALIEKLQPYFRIHPIMLVSVQQNGFRAYAHFQTHLLLALIQLENLTLRDLDLSVPPEEVDEELPF
jgi:hypothetical protein